MSLAVTQSNTLQVVKSNVINIARTSTVTDAEVGHFMADDFAIPATTTKVIDNGEITTIQYVYVESDVPVTVVLSGTISITNTTSVLLNGSFTSLAITNPSATLIANTKFIIAGD